MDKFTARFRRALDEHPEQATAIRLAFNQEGQRQLTQAKLAHDVVRVRRIKGAIHALRVTYSQWLLPSVPVRGAR